MIALQYHEVKVHVENTFKELFETPGAPEYKLWVDYVFLDTDERRRFSQLSHEYLIEQVQEQIVTDLDSGSELSFNHPVKELVWILVMIQQMVNFQLVVNDWWVNFN